MRAVAAPAAADAPATNEDDVGVLARLPLAATAWVALPAVLVSVAVLVPFLGKAFTIDDPLFMLQAQRALDAPFHSSGFEFAWDGRTTRFSQIQANGPVMAWLLIPAVLAGGSEVVAHLVSLVALCVALFATASLALRLGLDRRAATIATLLVAGAPAVLAMAGTVMPDVVALAFLVTAIERLLVWSQERRLSAAIAAAVLVGLAPMARLHVAALLPLAVLVFAWAPDPKRWRRPSLRELWPLAVGTLIAVAIGVGTRDPHRAGTSVAGAMTSLSAFRNASLNAVSYLTHLVFVVPLAVPWVIGRHRALLRRWPVFVASCGSVTLLLHAHGALGRQMVPVIVAVAALGATVLVDLLAETWSARRPFDWLLAAWIVFPLVALPYTHLPAKYLVPSAPAIAIVVARMLFRSMAARRATAAGLTAALLGLVLGVAVLRADARFAEIGRAFATRTVAPTVATGDVVWFAGEWGARWYAERAGARTFTVDGNLPAPGDVVVSTRIGHTGGPSRRWLRSRCSLMVRQQVSEAGGRTMNAESNAGFYSSGWGLLPWAWGDGVVEAFDGWKCPGRGAAETRSRR